jgi:membrane-associated protein
MELDAIIESLRSWPPLVVFLLLFVGALIEYLVPPLPGDTFVLAGAVLVAAFGWHFVPVLVVVTAGATSGAWLDFKIGQWLVRTHRLDRFGAAGQEAIEGIVRQMRRHGPVYLAVNRFLPGIRAFFFVAAGVAGVKTHQVLLWSTVSALAWNAGLVALGYALGKNLDALVDFLTQYTIVVWVLVLAVTGFFVGRLVLKRRRSSRERAARTPEDPSALRSPPEESCRNRSAENDQR